MTQELWSGADVRWVGPEHPDVAPGERAVVVDPGRHRMRSFTGLHRDLGRRSRRLGGGVVVRLTDGSELTVDPEHLELVAPDHPLRPEPDVELATWWLAELGDWSRPPVVADLVPASFGSVCEVGHPDSLGELDRDSAVALVALLGNATTTPDDVLVAVWEGWGDVPPARFPGAAHLPTARRGHFLLRGPLTGVLTSISAAPVGHRPVSGIWWPRDRAWFVHTEIDLSATFVAGNGELVSELAASADLDVEVTTFHRTAATR